MKIRILLLLFLLTFFLANYVNAGKLGKLGGVSRGIQLASRGGSSSLGSVLSKLFRSSSKSSSKLNYRSSPGSHTTGSRHFGSSSGGHTTGSDLTGYGSLSGRRTIESTPFGHAIKPLGSNPTGTISSQTSHQQNKDASSYLQTKGGDTPRPSQSNSGQSNWPYLASHNNTGRLSRVISFLESFSEIFPTSRTSSFTTQNKNSTRYSPSASSTNHLSKSTVVPLQNHAATFFAKQARKKLLLPLKYLQFINIKCRRCPGDLTIQKSYISSNVSFKFCAKPTCGSCCHMTS